MWHIDRTTSRHLRHSRRSRPTLLFGSVDQRSRLAVGREAPHALELDSPRPKATRLKLLDACLIQQAAESSRALPSATSDLTVTAVRHFLYWPSRTLS